MLRSAKNTVHASPALATVATFRQQPVAFAMRAVACVGYALAHISAREPRASNKDCFA